MSEEAKVYLDHLIPRENLRYQRPQQAFRDTGTTKQPILTLRDFLVQSEYKAVYRKPDFQRSTFAWTPEDCVLLLESVVQSQVVPSIIMWRSPDNGFRYILDGGHRISVVIAWLQDDWGESQVDLFDNPQQAELVRRAARQVRSLVEERIGKISDYELAAQEIVRLTKEGRNPSQEMGNLQNGKALERGLFFQALRSGDVLFNILWVNGDYKTAEQSFLKINRSGRLLTDWEKRLIENRDSSFARLVMSLASVHSAPYYWPDTVDDEVDRPQIEAQVPVILEKIKYLDKVLFQPEYRKPIVSPTQPIMVATGEKRPYYIAELLTIVKGYRGQSNETEELLAVDRDGPVSQIVDNGYRHITGAVELFDHIVGNPDPTDPANKSVEIVPLLYFYKSDGFYIRSLLYGFIYWLCQGNENEVRARKELFSAYRGNFERFFGNDKDLLVQALGRNVGSGAEVTLQTALYFDKLLQLLIKYGGNVEDEDLLNEYGEMVAGLTKGTKQSATHQAVRSRIFTSRQKSVTLIDAHLSSMHTCEICRGKLDPMKKVQHDHKQRRRDGGQTFCNQRRDQIEQIQSGFVTPLPVFSHTYVPNGPVQLSFLDDMEFANPLF
jgi:hypothetical protein